MTRGGIEYKKMPAGFVDINLIRTVATPFKSGVSKLDLTHELIEAVHQEASDRGAVEVWMADLNFRTLEGTDSLQAYTYAAFFRTPAAAA